VIRAMGTVAGRAILRCRRVRHSFAPELGHLAVTLEA
jgi:hypothetical protein